MSYAVDVFWNLQQLPMQQQQQQQQPQMQNENDVEDEDVLYSRLVLLALKKIQNPDIKFEAKQKIDRLLYDAQRSSRHVAQSQVFRSSDLH